MDLGEAVRQLRAAEARLPSAEERAAEIVRQARAEVARARAYVRAAIVAADERGMRQRDIAAQTGYSREHIRRILLQADEGVA